MAAKRKLNKRVQGRRFLNPQVSACLGAVMWHVELQEDWKDASKHKLWAEISVNSDCTSHYVERKGNMTPIIRLRDELNKFIDECNKALAILEKEKH